MHAAIMAHGQEKRSPAGQGDVPASQCGFARRVQPDGCADLVEVWKSLAGIGIPADALAAAQRDYVSEAAKVWNRLLMPSWPSIRQEEL